MIRPSGRENPASGVNGTEAFEDTVAACERGGVDGTGTGEEVPTWTGAAAGVGLAAVGAVVTERGV